MVIANGGSIHIPRMGLAESHANRNYHDYYYYHHFIIVFSPIHKT